MYSSGTVVQLHAAPADSYRFVFWRVNGVDYGHLPDIELTMNEDKEVRAVFARTDLQVQFDCQIEDGLNWVYQNTPASRANGGHKLRLEIEVLDLAGNDAAGRPRTLT